MGICGSPQRSPAGIVRKGQIVGQQVFFRLHSGSFMLRPPPYGHRGPRREAILRAVRPSLPSSDHRMTLRGFLLRLALLGLAALVAWQAVTRVSEYLTCLNERRHFPTNFTKYEPEIKS